MWLLAQLDPDEPTYNIAWAVTLSGPLDLDALRAAWSALLLRHESLRTRFRDEAGIPVQVVEDDPDLEPLELVSVDDLARTPFDLATGPLVRARLLRLGPEQHVLVVVVHHIVADGWSFRILFDELSATYSGASVAEPSIQYADFAIWQAEHAEDGGYALAERFWRAELAGAPTALTLPTDAAYPARQTFAARGIDLTVDVPDAATLGVTTFAVLLAAYATVLSRLTGSADLIIAVPMAARTRPETEPVVGLFMNTVPLRIHCAGSLADLARSVHASTARALAHQELPFARIVELIGPTRDPARLPLAQVMFAMEEPWTIPDRGGLSWSPTLVENGTAKFELELTITGSRARLNYNSALFHPDTAQLIADAFTAVLHGFATDPSCPVADVEIMTPATRALVTQTWPHAGPVVDSNATALAQLWAACGTETVVVRGSDGFLTGIQVRDRAAAIAATLREQGVGKGDRVGILLPRGARLLPAILGVWLTGAAYVPLDSIYPEQRLATMLDIAGTRAVLVDTSVPDSPSAPAEVPDLPPSAAAYMIFTSGSTGQPKAVTVSHGSIAALLAALQPLLALGPGDILVAITTITFDIALVELLAPILGAQVVVADLEHSLDGALLRELLISSGATAFQATPAGWRMLLDAGGIPEGIKIRISTGEALPRDLADAISAPGARVYNLYGPTEATVFAGGAAVDQAPLEIAAILPGTALYVLDADLRPVPPGVMGEVCIGGAGVATGYHGAPGLTAGRFVPDPLGGRLYAPVTSGAGSVRGGSSWPAAPTGSSRSAATGWRAVRSRPRFASTPISPKRSCPCAGPARMCAWSATWSRDPVPLRRISATALVRCCRRT
jgi:non-ribosomal peptide synthetase component F